MGASEWQSPRGKFPDELPHASSTIAHSFNASLLQTEASSSTEGRLKGWQGFTAGLDQALGRLLT